MKVNEKQVLCYDLKVFPNALICSIVDTEKDYSEIYEISSRKNQIKDMIGVFLCPDYIFAGYNTIHYSIPIINFIIDYYESIPDDYSIICKRLYSLSKQIIESDDFDSWKTWKHTKNFLTIDLYTMLASAKNRFGLKEAQITSGWILVKEFEKGFDTNLEETDIDSAISCSLNDAKSIVYLCNKVQDKIYLREEASKKYDVNLLSKDDVSMGLEILKKLYLERTGEEWSQIKDKKSPKETIFFKDILPDFLEFDTPVIKELVKELKTVSVNITEKKQYDKHFLLDDMEISFGMGGLHSIVEPDIIVPSNNQVLMSVDVRSMYPSFILKYGVVPPHINKSAFLYVFENIWKERLHAKDVGDTITSETLKNALNSAIGNYRVYTSWLYAPECAVKVNICCQLFILKLAEMLISVGCSIKQINTDGIIFLADNTSNWQSIVSNWQGLTCLGLDVDRYKCIYQYDINNYLAQRTFDEKKVGLFDDTTYIGKGMKPAIIARAVNEHFLRGLDVETVIKDSIRIEDFLTYQKVDKAYKVEYNDKFIQRINRYYASSNGCYLYKCKMEEGQIVDSAVVHFKDKTYKIVPRAQVLPGGEYHGRDDVSYFEYNAGFQKMEDRKLKYENMLKASGVKLANDLVGLKIGFPKDINYIYYIGEAKKIVSKLENRQLSLF